MFIEPGIMEQAAKAGVKAGLTDLNGDGKIDNADLQIARTNSVPLAASNVVKTPVAHA